MSTTTKPVTYTVLGEASGGERPRVWLLLEGMTAEEFAEATKEWVLREPREQAPKPSA